MFEHRTKRRVSLYVILGLTKKASEEEIHEAYQRLSKQYRQEANEGGTGCKRKIKEVEKAYRVLGDPALKRIYDEHGSVSWWVRFIDKFSPESIEKRGAFIRNLFTCCFGATCCCFCFCCCNCCHLGPHLNGVSDDEEDDELYVRENFSEFLPEEPDVCPNFMTKRRMKKERRRAARQRRRCYYDHRVEMKKKRQARSGGSDDGKMTQGGHSESNKSVLSRTDSGCDVVAVDNAGFILNEYDVSDRCDLAEIVLEKREPDSGRSSITENFHGEKNSSCPDRKEPATTMSTRPQPPSPLRLESSDAGEAESSAVPSISAAVGDGNLRSPRVQFATSTDEGATTTTEQSTRTRAFTNVCHNRLWQMYRRRGSTRSRSRTM
ncbi:uncharacterized protein [Diadema antillarum]|uniref:uncharacterized protein n=1 Tax=Diadema antillarum TaxID=105358 RepID=UPI003A86D78F